MPVMLLRRWLLALLGTVGLAVGSLVALRAWTQHRVARVVAVEGPDVIDTLERVSLGGVDQWIQIRGDDRRNPMLLFLHGGPGFPQMPFGSLNADLARDFVVVQWDQRGAGKSFSNSIPDASMNLDQFVADTRDLTRLLLRRFDTEKCLLVGHSWGSLVGAFTVARHPELFSGFVSIGQVVDLTATEQARYAFALAAAGRTGDSSVVTTLRGLGSPPYARISDFEVMDRWVKHYDGALHTNVPPGEFVRLAFGSPAYAWVDLVRIPLGVRYSYDHLWRQISYDIDLFRQVPRLDVPVTFLLGRHDWVVASAVAQRYADALEAPRGKRIVWFEESGHWPQFEEPEKYRAAIRAMR